MADEETEEQVEEAAPKSGSMKWIVIGVLLLALAGGGWFAYPMVMEMINPPEEMADAVPEEPADKPALFAPLLPPLIINFTDQYGDTRFMQMSLEVMARDQLLIDHVKNHAAVIRSNLILLFSNTNYEAAITREGKEKMLEDALAEIRQIIKKETGESGIEAVYFTGLVIQ